MTPGRRIATHFLLALPPLWLLMWFIVGYVTAGWSLVDVAFGGAAVLVIGITAQLAAAEIMSGGRDVR